jgi:hypothetical protein
MAARGEDVDEAAEEDFYLRRLDAGLFSLQLIDCAIVECCSSGNASVSIDPSTLPTFTTFYQRDFIVTDVNEWINNTCSFLTLKLLLLANSFTSIKRRKFHWESQ